MDLFQRFNGGQTSPCITDAFTDLRLGLPVPAYPRQESGVCLIIGTAPCWIEDVADALRKYPKADLCGVNEAFKLITCKHFATCHTERLQQWIDEMATQGPLPSIHMGGEAGRSDLMPDVFHWPDSRLGGTSAIFAAAAMLGIGYDMVILCGCPMNGGGGYATEIAENTHRSTYNDPRIGAMLPNHPALRQWQATLRGMHENLPDVAARIRSMSGFSKDIFGGVE